MKNLTPFQQAYYHAGCAMRHAGMAFAAMWHYWEFRGLVLILAFIAGALMSGCSTASPQRGGVATIGRSIMKPFQAGPGLLPQSAPSGGSKAKPSPDNAEVASISQPDNPGQQSSQNYETTKEDEITFAAPSVQTTEANGVKTTIQIPAGSKKTSREVQKVGQTLGASQKDTARETSAILGSFKWVQGLGVLTLLIGAIGFAHPVARALIGGKDTAVVISLVGVGMIAGPFLLVQYADWFLLGLFVAAAYWYVSRAKFKEGLLDAKTLQK